MPVRQLSQPSVSASAISSSETVMSTTRVSVTAGESASGAVGSSTTISISESDMRRFRYLSLSPARIGRHHPRPVYAGGFAGLKCQSAEALAKAGKRMIQYYARLMLFRKLVEYWVPRWSLSPGGASRRPGGGHDSPAHLLRHEPRFRHQRFVQRVILLEEFQP